MVIAASTPDPKSGAESQAKTSRNFLLRATGFKSFSTLFLFTLTAGFFSFFCSVHFSLLDKQGKWDTPLTRGERFWFLNGIKHVFNQIHMWSVIPAGFLLPLQFIPAIRRQFVALHRNAGRLLFVLLGVGSVTGLWMARYSFSGTVSTIAYAWCLFFLCTLGTWKSWSSIRRLDIDQHRIWALRTWSYAGSILSLRVIIVTLSFLAVVVPPDYKSVLSCAEIDFIQAERYTNETNITLQNALISVRDRYPACLNPVTGLNDTYVVVNVRFTKENFYPEERVALFNILFGISGILGLAINILAVETYIKYSKDEDQRMKLLSSARKKAAGIAKLVKDE